MLVSELYLKLVPSFCSRMIYTEMHDLKLPPYIVYVSILTYTIESDSYAHSVFHPLSRCLAPQIPNYHGKQGIEKQTYKQNSARNTYHPNSQLAKVAAAAFVDGRHRGGCLSPENKRKEGKVSGVTCLDKIVKFIMFTVLLTPRGKPDRCDFRLCFGSTCLQISV